MSKRKDIVSAILLYIVAITFLVIATQMKGDAGLFPKFLSLLIIILNTIQLIMIFLKKAKPSKNIDDLVIKKIFIIILDCLIYVIVIKYLGFIISTILFLVSTVFLLDVKNKKIGVITSIITVLVIYVCFKLLLKVPIPYGVLGI